MKNQTLQAIEDEYDHKYGHIPEDESALLDYLESTLKLDMVKLEEEEVRIDSLPWNEANFILPIIPKPSPRPRYSFKTEHFYVMGASVNKKLLKKYIDRNKIIYTRTELYVETYQPTPISIMSKNEIYLAEKKKIVPIQNPDQQSIFRSWYKTHLIAGIFNKLNQQPILSM